ncbi:hypothetical protein [Candidatus Methylacidithermus pantelleriae]|uniref:Uncharacterized protein n=1 Tax=Candidatus Methylacidithermus pantelleriae TaxID=2744239 RepID=A0A8J2BRS8_9BACT|nr:hypothetical protein [Candidatus Methylacidithermus pantelleriae]CAF0702385.1 hypothetical protein MPNT_50057 [Candidatus Methylacidithermus pantelleriae]
MGDLTLIRDRIKAGKRLRACRHRWAWRQLPFFVEYKESAVRIAVDYVDPPSTSQSDLCWRALGKPL